MSNLFVTSDYDSEYEPDSDEDSNPYKENHARIRRFEQCARYGDVEGFRAFYNKRDFHCEMMGIVESIGKKCYDSRLFPNFVEIAKIVISGHRAYHDTWFIHTHGVACCVGNKMMTDYLERTLLRPHEIPKGKVVIRFFSDEHDLHAHFAENRLMGAVYRNNQVEIGELMTGEKLPIMYGYDWLYYTAVLRNNSFVTTNLRSNVHQFETKYTPSSDILKRFERFDALGCIFRDDMEGFQVLTRNMRKKRIKKVFDQIIYQDDLHPGIVDYFPRFNIPIRFYIYFVKYIGETMYLDHIYKYAIFESKLKPVKTRHTDLIEYLSGRYPSIVYEVGLWEMAVENNDCDSVRKYIHHFNIDDIVCRAQNVISFDMLKLMLMYINLTGKIIADKGWKSLKIAGKNYNKPEGKIRYDWVLDYFKKWNTEMISTSETLVLCINRLYPPLQNLIPEMMLFYKRMVMDSMSTDFTYCEIHNLKKRVDRCKKCSYDI